MGAQKDRPAGAEHAARASFAPGWPQRARRRLFREVPSGFGACKRRHAFCNGVYFAAALARVRWPC